VEGKTRSVGAGAGGSCGRDEESDPAKQGDLYWNLGGPNNRQNSGDLRIPGLKFKFLVPGFLAWKWLNLA